MSGMSIATGRAIDGLDHLRQSIAVILMTPLGSRVMRRNFGSLLPVLLDAPDNGATRVRLYSAVAGALMTWEPRLRITRVAVSSGSMPGQVVIDITGTYIPAEGQQQALALRVPLLAQASS